MKLPLSQLQQKYYFFSVSTGDVEPEITTHPMNIGSKTVHYGNLFFKINEFQNITFVLYCSDS